MESSSFGSGGHKQWISCSEVKHFEMIKIILLSKHRAELPSVKTKEQPCSTWETSRGIPFSTGALSWAFQCKHPFPSQSTPKLGRLDLQGLGERQAEEQYISLISYALRSTDHVGVLRNATRKWCTNSPCPLSIHQMTCMDTSLAKAFLLAPVPKPLHSWFFFPGRAWGVFSLFPPPSFLARGHSPPQNRLQDRYCRVPRSVIWLEERMKNEMKPHSLLFRMPC